jgi:hypothetical protein
MSGKFKVLNEELIGKKFGKLTVIKLVNKNDDGRFIFETKCDCGEIKNATKSKLLHNHILCCDLCAQKERNDERISKIPGKKFGKLTVLKCLPSSTQNLKFIVQCDCGENFEIDKNSVMWKEVLSCKNCKSDQIIVDEENIKSLYVIKNYVKNEDMIDQNYGILKILSISHIPESGGNIKLNAQCACGNLKEVYKHSVLKGETKSCGECGYRNSIRENLIGKIFGKLKVIGQEPPIDQNRMWLCICECGNKTSVTTGNLNSENSQACGLCRSKIELLTGQKINRILVGKKVNSNNYLCNCDCGNIRILDSNKIKNEGKKSCGCLRIRTSKNIKLIINHLKFLKEENNIFYFICDCGRKSNFTYNELSHNMGKHCECMNSEYDLVHENFTTDRMVNHTEKDEIARRAWREIIARDKFNYENNKFTYAKFDLLLEDYLNIVKQNCFYCNEKPNLNRRGFVHNTIERITSVENHHVKNCISACFQCNISKTYRSMKDFLNWIPKLKININTKIEIKSNKFPPASEGINSIRDNTYSDSNLTKEEFYYLIQQPCFYCGESKVNNRKGFRYNGLDRIKSLNDDGTKANHNKDNVVPCCKWCNYAKLDYTLEEFNNWIKRIQEYQSIKNQYERLL